MSALDPLLADLSADAACADAPAQGVIADLQQRLAHSEAHAAALRTELERFVHSVSHDLRAPLRHISAYAPLVREMLDEGDDPGPCLDILEQSARNMARMVDALLELSRLSRVPLQPGPVPMAALVAEAQRTLATEHAAELSERVVDWRIPDDWPVQHGDAALLRLLWKHLLSNALKFTRPRTRAQITLDWERTDSGLVYCVRDNGVGFNPAASSHMFDLFHRLHTSAEFDGAGIGLALARQIVQRHGGSIQAEGVVGEGCTVRVTLALH